MIVPVANGLCLTSVAFRNFRSKFLNAFAELFSFSTGGLLSLVTPEPVKDREATLLLARVVFIASCCAETDEAEIIKEARKRAEKAFVVFKEGLFDYEYHEASTCFIRC